MEALVLLILRFALLALLWFFVFMAVRSLRRDTESTGGGAAAGAPAAGGEGGHRRQSAGRSKMKGRAPVVGSESPRQLEIIEGPLAGSTLELADQTEITIGRNPDCEFTVGDTYASGRHARLLRRGPEWFLEDLDSLNGTSLNGFRIEQPERVRVGDYMKIGRSIVRLVP